MVKFLLKFLGYLFGSLAVIALLLFSVLQPFTRGSTLDIPEPQTYGLVASQNSKLPIEPSSAPNFISTSKPLETPAFAIYALDITSDEILFQKNIHERWPTASLAKLMTALVAVELRDLNEVFVVAETDIKISLPRMELVPNENITLESLLYGMLISSANDAAQTIAREATGSTEQFIGLMNEFARKFKMENSHFMNSTGFDETNQFTSAYDVATLTKIFLNNEFLSEIVKNRNSQVRSFEGNFLHRLNSTNQLLAQDGFAGVKTGFTDLARGNLVTLYSHQNGNQILMIVLGSENREQDTQNLLNWILQSYEFPKIANL